MDKQKRVALYYRVSTADQSIGLQRTDLRHYARACGFTIYKEYSDEGVSGAKVKRPGLDRLMDDARKRRFDVVAVWRFDRFARSSTHLALALDEFRHLSIGFISFNETVDTSSPTGKVMYTLIAAMAEFERAIIRERVTAGVRQAIKRRKSWGRVPVEQADPTSPPPSASYRERVWAATGSARSWVCHQGTVWKVLQRQGAFARAV